MPAAVDGVKVTLGGKERRLYYGARALRAIEQETGKNLLNGGIGLDLSFTEVITFVWAGLLHEDKGLEPDDVVDLIDIGRIVDITEAVGEALTAAFPKGDRQKGKAKRPAKVRASPSTG